MNLETTVYDHEGALEVAVQRALDLLEVNPITPSDAPQLQKDRPRCEVIVEYGASGSTLYPEVGKSVESEHGWLRELVFIGKCHISVITLANMETHSLYRAIVRSAASTMLKRVNFTFLKFHRLRAFKSSGCEYYREAGNGYYMTRLSFDIKWSIQAEAIRQLIADDVIPVPVPITVQPVFVRNADSTLFRQLNCSFEGIVNIPYLSDDSQAVGNTKVLVKNESDGLYYEYIWTDESGVPVRVPVPQFLDDPDDTAEFQIPVYIVNDTDGLTYELRCRTEADNVIVPYLIPT